MRIRTGGPLAEDDDGTDTDGMVLTGRGDGEGNDAAGIVTTGAERAGMAAG